MKKTLTIALATALLLTFPVGGFAIGDDDTAEPASAAWGTVPLGADPGAVTSAGESSHLGVEYPDIESATVRLPLAVTDSSRPTYVEGQVVVQMSGGAATSALAGVAGVAGIQRGRIEAEGTDIVVVDLLDGTSVSDALTALAGADGVAHVQPNYIAYPTGTGSIPNDPLFPYLWGMHNTSENSGTPDADIDAPEAWGTETGSDRTIVAVIDTGIDPGHPGLIDNLWTNRREIPRNNKDDDGNGYVDDIHGYDVVRDSGALSDTIGHGTHVAGTIGAQGNDIFGVTGVSQDVSIMTLRADGASGGFTTAALVESIVYADKMGAKIVNMSLGGYSADPLVASAMSASDALFVCASGNDGNDNDSNPFYPASEPLPNIIAVGATAPDDSMASFSNYGATTVDLAAPGVDILSTFIRPESDALFADDFDYLGAWDTSDNWQKPWTLSDARHASPKTSMAQVSPKATEWAWTTLKNPVDVQGSATPVVTFWLNSSMVPGEDYLYVWVGTDTGLGGMMQLVPEGSGWIPVKMGVRDFPSGAKLRLAFVYASDTARSVAPGSVFIDDLAVYTDDSAWLPWTIGSGTSMAAPHVAGVAALIKSRKPEVTTAEIKGLLMANVDPLASLAGRVATGGRLNAAKAIAATPKPSETAEVKRIAGKSRFAVSADIARQVYYKDDNSWAGTTDVIIASGDDAAAADPLSAAGLTWAKDAPLLLVGKDYSPPEVEQVLYEIAKKNGAVSIHVVGGEKSIPNARLKDVVARAKSAGSVTIAKRYGVGADRFAVAAQIAETVRLEWQSRHGKNPPVVLAANGADPATFFDALALSAVSSAKGYPISLLYSDKVPSPSSSAISKIKPDRIIVSGGYKTVAPATLQSLDGMAVAGAERWAGATRYDTAVAIADRSIDEGWLSKDKAMVAAKLPDALTGGSMLGRSGTPLLVTVGTRLSDPADLWLIDYSLDVDTCYILGGTASVKPAVETRIRSVLR